MRNHHGRNIEEVFIHLARKVLNERVVETENDQTSTAQLPSRNKTHRYTLSPSNLRRKEKVYI